MPARNERGNVLRTKVETAEALGVSTQTIGRLTYEGKLPYVKIGTAVRIRQSDIDDYIDAHTVNASAKKAGRSR
jgi:excisionase family DNA binding protein